MFPAAQCRAVHVGAIMNGRSLPSPRDTVRSAWVASACGALRWSRRQADQPLPHIEAAALRSDRPITAVSLARFTACEFFPPAGCHMTTSYRNSAARSHADAQAGLQARSATDIRMKSRETRSASRLRAACSIRAIVCHRCIKIEKTGAAVPRYLVFLMNETIDVILSHGKTDNHWPEAYRHAGRAVVAAERKLS